MIKILEGFSKFSYWIVQNTGWSSGSSWFSEGGLDEEFRFDDEESAINHAMYKKKYLDDPSIKWRLVHVTIERDEFGETIRKNYKVIE